MRFFPPHRNFHFGLPAPNQSTPSSRHPLMLRVTFFRPKAVLGPQACDVSGSKTLQCQSQRPGIPAARFKRRNLLPVETLKFLKLLDASVVLEVVQPQRPVSFQDAELNLCWVGREARIQGAAKEVRARMLLAVPFHAPPRDRKSVVLGQSDDIKEGS